MAKPLDIQNQRFGKILVKSLIPEEERRNAYKRREWLCECDCGNSLIIEQRNLTGSKYQQLSCGCTRVKFHLLKTSKIKGLTFEFIDSFEDYEKYAYLHKQFVKHFTATEDFEIYEKFINKFYIDNQFNLLYNKWVKENKENKENTFYDLYKPSLDHIIPKSKGGDNSLDNLQFLTVFENLSKRDMTMKEWNEFKVRTNTPSDLYL